MELINLYNAICVFLMFFSIYFVFKLYFKVLMICLDSDSKLNKVFEKLSKRSHFNKYYRKWLRKKELKSKYNDFYEYYIIQYNKSYEYFLAYDKFLKFMEENNVK